MAPSSDGEDIKYKSWSTEDLKSECTKRNLKFLNDDSAEILINILIKDDNKPPDWGKIYSRVLYHTGMSYEEISRRTIPQIMAILDGAEENLSIKMGIGMGMPGIGGGTATTNEESAQEDVEDFFNSF